MRNFKLVLSYDGTDFYGWQTQPNRRTVQETLERAIADLTGEAHLRINASGRTDAGVHALGQVVNFHSTTELAPHVLLQAINARLPEDIIISSCAEVPLDFDANRHAISKLYHYVIHVGSVPNPLMRRYCCHSRWPLDVDLMRQGAEILKGKHDFACFETEGPNRASSVRTISRLVIHRAGPWIWIAVEADGFLYNMVRAIAGTLMNVGRGYWPPEHVRQILESKDRSQAGPTAPAKGLFLLRVNYE